jgi:hypothetical protein
MVAEGKTYPLATREGPLCSREVELTEPNPRELSMKVEIVIVHNMLCRNGGGFGRRVRSCCLWPRV